MPQTGMILSLNQRLCGLLMVSRFIENGLEGVGSSTRTMLDRLSGVRKNVGDQLCLICMSSGEIW